MKRILCIFLLAVMLVPMLCIGAGATVYEGLAVDVAEVIKQNNGVYNSEEDREFFENALSYKIKYKLDTETGVLDITCGTDENGNKKTEFMLPYIALHWVPWQNNDMMKSVKTVRVEEGIGSMGRYTLAYADSLKEVYLPHSIKKINRTVFYQCKSLEAVYYAGNKNDFNKVVLDEIRNWTGTDQDGNNTIDEWEVDFTLLDKIHYGESVTVNCRNEEGDLITKYTVGGYFPGDPYTITPLAMEGLTYVGDQAQITGQFKEGDDTVYELVYHCDHEYKLRFPNVPCSSFCTKCGRSNPDVHDLHTWGEPVVVSERGFLTPLDQSVICQQCNAKIREYEYPYGPIVSVAIAAPILVTGIVLAIVIPIRKRKKVKDMTW